ncbi:ERG2/sigma1 receptor-like protein [Morchella snyderi]|nr:ERG2/sigma1 receptor-like protein [Morchella snyderi]
MRFIIAFLPLMIFAFKTLDAMISRFYIFDPAKLQELSQNSIAKYGGPGGNTTLLLEDLVEGLRTEYGDKHVNKLSKEEWFFNNAGGAMGAMIILHASITEYLIIFGTPLGTEGHSGVHLAHDYFTILSGEQQFVKPGEIEPTVYSTGMQNHLPRGDAGQYILKGWALELAQGWIPSMLPFGFLDTFTSTLDFANIWKTTYLTGKGIIGQLMIGKI